MTSRLPIVFIHKGNSWYLPYTLWQAHQTNPQQPIYFIGDASTKHFPRWVRHVEISKYASSTSRFDAVYKHKSQLGAEFEQMCIQRWFILDAFWMTTVLIAVFILTPIFLFTKI